jgi:hypothetical protein
MCRAAKARGRNSRDSGFALLRIAGAPTAFFLLMMLLAHVEAAHGAEDPPDLMQTLVAEDATLNNNLNPIELRWVPGRNRRQIALGFGVEKIVANNLGLEVMSEWEDNFQRFGRSGNGFENIDVTLKYVLWKYPEGDFQIALTPTISVRTSSHIGDEDLSTSAGVGMSWGGRLSVLKNARWERYFPAVEFQGDLGYSRTLGASSADTFYLDPVIDYSLPYLSYTGVPAVPWPLRNLCIFAEINFDQPLSSPNDGSRMFLTPGVSYLNKYLQISAGIQIALNGVAASNENTALLGSVTIFLDALEPAFARTLF